MKVNEEEDIRRKDIYPSSKTGTIKRRDWINNKGRDWREWINKRLQEGKKNIHVQRLVQ